jgi:LPXTG-site transpeptidase (sortase) family protein
MNIKSLFPSNEVLKAILHISAIFLVAFIVITILFSAYSWISGVGDNISVAINKDANNERLTETYRKLYGYGSGYTDTGFDDNYFVDNRVESSGAVAGAIVNVSNAVNGTGTTIVAGDYLYIPKLNIKAPIITGQTADSKVLLTLLNSGVIIYPNSAMPGNAGSTVIIGHSSSNSLSSKYGKVFAGLNRLVSGDQVLVHYGNKDYIYTITRKNTGTVNELSALGLNDDLILGTCWPIGTDKERIIVGAKLVTN